MTRRAFLSSKSNTGAGEIEIKRACQKLGKMDHKNQDFSESLNSFDLGAFFWPSLGQDLSRNAFVVSVLFLERFSYVRTVFFLTPKMSKFHQFSKFRKIDQNASRKLPEGRESSFRYQGVCRMCSRHPIDCLKFSHFGRFFDTFGRPI